MSGPTKSLVARYLPVIALLTIPAALLLPSYFWVRQWGISSVLYSLMGFHLLSLITFPLIYIAALTYYARSLRSLLTKVPEPARVTSVRSVCLIAIFPLNLVGGFFVIAGIARSLPAVGQFGAQHQYRWRTMGFSWCGLQLAALLPVTALSVVATVAGYGLWAAHWAYSVWMDGQLSDYPKAGPDE